MRNTGRSKPAPLPHNRKPKVGNELTIHCITIGRQWSGKAEYSNPDFGVFCKALDYKAAQGSIQCNLLYKLTFIYLTRFDGEQNLWFKPKNSDKKGQRKSNQ